MTQILTFENALLAGTGKRGDLKPMDSSGYYKVNSGGFNIPNRHKITYVLNDYIRECMRPGSDFDRRVKEGQMYCELDHPPQYYNVLIQGQVVRKPITDLFEWVNRLRTIDMNNVCGHIRKVHWLMTGGPRDPVYNEIEVIPFGFKKSFMQESLENPDINSAFSIRTVTKQQEFGHTEREVDYWSTYDFVPEQGVARACKHLSAGLESLIESYQPNPDEPEIQICTTYEELMHICNKQLSMPEVRERFAGTESLKQVQSMLDEMAKNQPRKETKIQLVTRSALGAFV